MSTPCKQKFQPRTGNYMERSFFGFFPVETPAAIPAPPNDSKRRWLALWGSLSPSHTWWNISDLQFPQPLPSLWNRLCPVPGVKKEDQSDLLLFNEGVMLSVPEAGVGRLSGVVQQDGEAWWRRVSAGEVDSWSQEGASQSVGRQQGVPWISGRIFHISLSRFL